MAIRSRVLLGVLLAVTLALPGLIVGAAVGAVFFVPAGSGLAGPAIALGYGLVGALLAVASAAALGRWLPLQALRWTLAGSTIVAFLGLCLVAYRFHEVRQEASRQHAATTPSPLQRAYDVHVEVTEAGAAAGLPVQEMRLVQGDGSQRVSWITRGAEQQRCEDAMVGLEGVDLAARLQVFAPQVLAGFRGCTHEVDDGPRLYTVRWSAAAELTAATAGELAMNAHCLQVLVAARDLVDQVRAIHDRAGPTASCEPVSGGLAAR